MTPFGGAKIRKEHETCKKFDFTFFTHLIIRKIQAHFYIPDFTHNFPPFICSVVRRRRYIPYSMINPNAEEQTQLLNAVGFINHAL